MVPFPPAKPVSRRTFLNGTLLAAGAVGASTVLSGCTAKSGGSSGSTASRTVTVMYQSSEFTKEHIAGFEKENPGVTIEFIENDGTRLNAMMAAGNPPDMVRGQADTKSLARGLIAPLDQYLDASTVIKKDDLLPITNGNRWDGKNTGVGPYYALIKDWSPDACLWQHATLFERAGVPRLSTTARVSWDDVLEVAKKLTVRKNGKTVQFGLGMEWAWGLVAPINLMLAQQGFEMYSSDLLSVDFTSPPVQRAMQWYADFGRAGVGPTSLNPLPDNADYSTFAAGKMALTMDGYWFGGQFQKAPADLQKAISMTPAPTFGKPLNASFSGGVGAYIPAKAKNPDLGWKVLEYFIGGPPAVERAKAGWGLPALKSLWQYLPQQHEYQISALKTAQEEAKLVGTVFGRSSPYVTFEQWQGAIDQNLQSVIKGKASVADACGRIQDTMNKAIKKGKAQVG